jgi:hypothetical protein
MNNKTRTIDCPHCEGTGIGYGGPDSRCADCRGRGYSFARDEDDDPPDGDFDESRFDGPMPGDDE